MHFGASSFTWSLESRPLRFATSESGENCSAIDRSYSTCSLLRNIVASSTTPASHSCTTCAISTVGAGYFNRMLSKKGFDLVRPIHRSSRFDKHKLKAKVPINLLVDAFETERIFETDAPCRGG